MDEIWRHEIWTSNNVIQWRSDNFCRGGKISFFCRQTPLIEFSWHSEIIQLQTEFAKRFWRSDTYLLAEKRDKNCPIPLVCQFPFPLYSTSWSIDCFAPPFMFLQKFLNPLTFAEYITDPFKKYLSDSYYSITIEKHFYYQILDIFKSLIICSKWLPGRKITDLLEPGEG